MEIHDPLSAGLASRPSRMVVAFADHDPALPVGDVLQVKTKRFARPETALSHQ